MTGIAGLLNLKDAGRLNGAVLADVIGLGKSFQVAGFILALVNDRRRLIARAKATRGKDGLKGIAKARPFLIIVPSSLLM